MSSARHRGHVRGHGNAQAAELLLMCKTSEPFHGSQAKHAA